MHAYENPIDPRCLRRNDCFALKIDMNTLLSFQNVLFIAHEIRLLQFHVSFLVFWTHHSFHVQIRVKSNILNRRTDRRTSVNQIASKNEHMTSLQSDLQSLQSRFL